MSKKQVLTEFTDPISSFAAISLIIGILSYFLKLFMNCVIFKQNHISNSTYDEALSQAIRNITKDDTVKVYIIPEKVMPIYNAFNISGTECFITEKLFNRLNYNETLAVLLHEYAHGINGDVHKTIISSSLTVTILTFFSGIIITSFPGTIILTMVANSILYVLTQAHQSRNHEREADKLVKKMGYQKPLASALEKLYAASREEFCKTAQLKPVDCKAAFDKIFHPNDTSIVDTHPAINERIAELLKSDLILKLIKSENVMGLKNTIDYLESLARILFKHGLSVLNIF